jgi:hypothetical protein
MFRIVVVPWNLVVVAKREKRVAILFKALLILMPGALWRSRWDKRLKSNSHRPCFHQEIGPSAQTYQLVSIIGFSSATTSPPNSLNFSPNGSLYKSSFRSTAELDQTLLLGAI